MVKDVLEYAEGLYALALKSMEKGQFRMADIYALSAHGAASYVAAQSGASKDLKDKAIDLEDAAWQLSKDAYAGIRAKLLRPNVSGSGEEYLEDVRYTIYEMAERVSRGGKRRS